MDLDRRQAELRARTSFEAIDLGFAMTRRWAPSVWKGWLVGVAPLLVVLWLSSFVLPWMVVAFVAWWLKPLYERVPLFVLSRGLFGATPTTAQTLRALPGLFWHRLFMALTVYRFDPARTFLTPVSLLERLGGRARSRRRSVLARGQWAASIWLTFACWLMEMTMWGGLVGMVALLLPEGPQWHWETLIALDMTWRVILGLWMCALSLVEPFYAGGGFGLYINRRTRLEGWDVELVFRSLAQRVGMAAALLMALLPGLAHADTGLGSDEFVEEGDTAVEFAQPPDVPFHMDQGSEAKIGAVVDEVLEDEIFGHTEERPRWVLQEDWAQRLEAVWPDGCLEEEANQTMPDSALSPVVALIIEAAFWVLGAVAVVALAWVLLRSRFARDLSVDIELPGPVVGESTQQTERVLPPSLADKARQLLAEGDVEGALGLLYNGSVQHLVQVHGLAIQEGATEGEVLRVVRRKARSMSGYFRDLTKAWLEVAYAHRSVSVERVRALIDAWPTHFAGGM